MSDRTHPRALAAALLVAALHLAVGYVYAASGLVAPPAGVLALLAVWAAFGVLAVLVHRHHGPLALLVPPLALVALFVLLGLGGAVFGWSA